MLLGFYLLLHVLYVTKGCNLINNRKTSNITAHVGDAVLLPCSCSDLRITPQKLKWLKYNNLNRDWDSVPTNQSRIQLSNVQPPGNLSLLISHLTVEDDGLYRCQIRQTVYTDINLSVIGRGIMTPSKPMSKAFLAFVPVLLLLLGLGGVIFWRYRAKKREQTLSNKGPTGQKNVEETQDGVMYTTLVHTNTTQGPKVVSTEERTEYAIIKLN